MYRLPVAYHTNLSTLPTYNQPSTLVNDVGDNVNKSQQNLSTFQSTASRESFNWAGNNYAPLPLFNCNTISIPSKVLTILKRHTPLKNLKTIHNDPNVALEHCLAFLSKLNGLQYINSEKKANGWIPLKAEYLRKYFSYSPTAYKAIIEVLSSNHKFGPILECDKIFEKGVKSFNYRISDHYFSKGNYRYELKTREAISLYAKDKSRVYKYAFNDSICKNLLEFYPQLELPKIDDLFKEAKKLIKSGYRTKKGKRLCSLNKHSRNYFKSENKLSFVEDGIYRYKFLTERGLFIPISGSEASGGRVIDSLTLMPGWIRNLIKINGERLIECDFICLHPNIAMKLYGDCELYPYLTHQNVASSVGIDIIKVKKEHLSLFNKPIVQIMHSPLYKYYTNLEGSIMDNVIEEKAKSGFGHKITSRRLFKIEVELMTKIIKALNQENIYVGYVYDALLCKPKDVQRVLEIMNSTALALGIKTKAKC
jgi:hypothetical protein